MSATAIVPSPSTGAEMYRRSTDAAGLCKDIVTRTARDIQGRKYVCVEGWQAIAIAHGCTASSGPVERVNDPACPGFRAIGTVNRMDNGQPIATAEGFVGDDEKTWNGRPVYARRAMAQTRAISRACRSAFAHVVVMMNAGLSTTPAEEVPDDGFHEAPAKPAPKASAAVVAVETPQAVQAQTLERAREVADGPRFTIPGGKERGKALADATASSLNFWRDRIAENIDNPEKSRFRESNVALLDALESELERRGP